MFSLSTQKTPSSLAYDCGMNGYSMSVRKNVNPARRLFKLEWMCAVSVTRNTSISRRMRFGKRRILTLKYLLAFFKLIYPKSKTPALCISIFNVPCGNHPVWRSPDWKKSTWMCVSFFRLFQLSRLVFLSISCSTEAWLACSISCEKLLTTLWQKQMNSCT